MASSGASWYSNSTIHAARTVARHGLSSSAPRCSDHRPLIRFVGLRLPNGDQSDSERPHSRAGRVAGRTQSTPWWRPFVLVLGLLRPSAWRGCRTSSVAIWTIEAVFLIETGNQRAPGPPRSSGIPRHTGSRVVEVPTSVLIELYRPPRATCEPPEQRCLALHDTDRRTACVCRTGGTEFGTQQPPRSDSLGGRRPMYFATPRPASWPNRGPRVAAAASLGSRPHYFPAYLRPSVPRGPPSCR